jgi:predicted O-linked N-acetylglucosamine transferase (SPINDLY family)
MAADFFDALFTDCVASAPSLAAAAYGEPLVYLPGTYFASSYRQLYPEWNPEAAGSRETRRARAGLPTNRFVYCCFNQLYKVRDHCPGLCASDARRPDHACHV